MGLRRGIVVVMCGLMLLAGGATAEVVRGVVLDADGNPRPGVSVALLEGGDGAFVETVTDDDGRFSVDVAADAPYLARLQLLGFVGVEEWVEVEVCRELSLEFELEYSGTVNVEGCGPGVVETGESQVSTVLSDEDVGHLAGQ